MNKNLDDMSQNTSENNVDLSVQNADNAQNNEKLSKYAARRISPADLMLRGSSGLTGIPDAASDDVILKPDTIILNNNRDSISSKQNIADSIVSSSANKIDDVSNKSIDFGAEAEAVEPSSNSGSTVELDNACELSAKEKLDLAIARQKELAGPQNQAKNDDNDEKKEMNPFSAYAVASQVGFIVIVPLLLFIMGGSWLVDTLEWAAWVKIVFVFVGIFTMIAALVAYLSRMITLFGGGSKRKAGKYDHLKSDKRDTDYYDDYQ